MSISNRIRDDGALSVLLGKKTWARLKRKGTFWSEDFDDLKKSLKISDRKRQRSAIDIPCAESVISVPCRVWQISRPPERAERYGARQA
jgi:hypothetical protein